MSDVQIAAFHTLMEMEVRVKVVDIGANPIDAEPPYVGLLRAGQAEVVGSEPNEKALEVLNTRKGPNETYFPHAVGDGTRHTLHICQAPGMTSLLKPNRTVLGLFHGFPVWGTVLRTVEVDTVRLDDVPATEGVDLIKMDIQGGELMVLQNAESRLRDALVIQSEVEFLPLYENQPLFSDVEQFLRARGFVFHRFYPQVSRVIEPLVVGDSMFSGLSQLVWADGIFVRDFTRLDLLSDRQLLAMAAIVHDCYGSFDLALHLVRAHDRRTGGTLAARYFAALGGK